MQITKNNSSNFIKTVGAKIHFLKSGGAMAPPVPTSMAIVMLYDTVGLGGFAILVLDISYSDITIYRSFYKKPVD